MRLIELNYESNTTDLFSVFADEPWSIWLDSCTDKQAMGRYDIFSSRPVTTIVTRDNVTTITDQEGITESTKDPLELLQARLDALDFEALDLPFSGGALGYFSYDLGGRFEALPNTTDNDEDLPLMAVGLYNWAVVVDHKLKMSTLVIQGDKSSTKALQQELLETIKARSAQRSFFALEAVQHDVEKTEYAKRFERVKEYILAGDCYQINYAQRFTVQCQGSLFAAYERLRDANAAPYAAFMNLPFVTILSSSPELFISCENNEVTSKPIKGTVPRSSDTNINTTNIDRLKHSEKDRAENVMIVDLLRNDFSKNCKLHTVKVPHIFAIESYARVHHLVSTVTGTLKEEHTSLDLIRGAFPGGSITGAPKIRAMEIIDELEQYRRGVYCGSIGYIDANGDTQLNIAIRTMTYQNGKIRFWAGGGIVHDSTIEGEYQESLDKASALVGMLSEQDQE